MASMAMAAMAATAGSAVIGAVGQLSAANSAANAASYNAAVAMQNAKQAQVNKGLAAQAGEAQVAQQQLRTRAQVGQLEANQAASGVDINKGSALDVRASATELGSLDAMTVRTNAVKEAYGYDVKSVNDKAESQLDRMEATADKTAGYFNAASTLLGGAGSAGSQYQQYKIAGGLDGTPTKSGGI